MFPVKHIASLLGLMIAVALIYLFILQRSTFIKGFIFENKVYRPVILPKELGNMSYDLIKEGLPGQPRQVEFNQYAGYINVDELSGRSLFYYFVEADVSKPILKPIILWLNGGPGCSSLGNGAFLENGPFQLHSDGRRLYLRQFSWNKVANILYLESPAGVGFSYSNTTSDYTSPGDLRTAQDSFTFLLKWFQRFSPYKNNNFYIAGESYAGIYIPELAQVIIQHNDHAEYSSTIPLKGVMIGNGLMNRETDFRGVYDYAWSHALISDETHHGIIKNCIKSFSSKCLLFQSRAAQEMGNTNVYDVYSEYCSPTDPCEKRYVSAYLNLPRVQKALHANTTKLPYSWGLCSFVIRGWGDSTSTVLPIYKKLIDARLQILIYSGDTDVVIPVTGTRYSINAMNLRVKKNWQPWVDDTQQVAGFKVEYEGLTFMTVLGASHEVPRSQPRKAFSLVKLFLEGVIF